MGTLQSLPSDWLLSFKIGGACFLLNSAFFISKIIFKINSFLWPSSSSCFTSFFSSIIPLRILSILKGIIEEKKDILQLEEDGYKKDLILKIITLIKKAEFKRKQAPPILKLSSQSLGSDWRVPIAISY